MQLLPIDDATDFTSGLALDPTNVPMKEECESTLNQEKEHQNAIRVKAAKAKALLEPTKKNSGAIEGIEQKRTTNASNEGEDVMREVSSRRLTASTGIPVPSTFTAARETREARTKRNYLQKTDNDNEQMSVDLLKSSRTKADDPGPVEFDDIIRQKPLPNSFEFIKSWHNSSNHRTRWEILKVRC